MHFAKFMLSCNRFVTLFTGKPLFVLLSRKVPSISVLNTSGAVIVSRSAAPVLLLRSAVCFPCYQCSASAQAPAAVSYTVPALFSFSVATVNEKRPINALLALKVSVYLVGAGCFLRCSDGPVRTKEKQNRPA